MLTLNDIVNISFRKANFSGYRPEDVDNFIDRVKESYEALIKKGVEQKEELDRVHKENEQLQKKMELLAQKIEEYRNEEDEIKNALVSAQKLGDASVREARHKAEIILKDANLKAERIVASAEGEIDDQKNQLEELKKETSKFRASLLDLYKEHLTLIKAIPSYKEEAPVPAEKKEVEQEEPVVQKQEEPKQEETVQPPIEPINNSSEKLSFHAEVANFEETQEIDLSETLAGKKEESVQQQQGTSIYTDLFDKP